MKNASRRMIIMCMLIVFVTNVFSIKANAAFDVNAYLCQYAEKNYKATIAQMYEAEYKKSRRVLVQRHIVMEKTIIW